MSQDNEYIDRNVDLELQVVEQTEIKRLSNIV